MGDKALLDRHNFKFKKQYGQNFLTDRKIPARIAENCTALPVPEAEDGRRCDEVILEIGPGAGILTKELALRYRRVAAVEIDPNLIPILSEALADFPNTSVLNEDIMAVDLPAFVAEITENGKYPVSVCANLPYYITTPILMKLLETRCGFGFITVMVQKEVARRLCAAPGSPDYGSISAEIGLYGQAAKLFDVPSGCFNPRPKVDSAVVKISLDKSEKYPIDLADKTSALIRAAFGQRRKTLVNSLSVLGGRLVSQDKAELGRIIANTLGVPEDVRGEKLSTAQFAALAPILIK